MIIKNGLILIDNQLVPKDIEITGEKITKIADVIEGDDYLDAKDCFIMPGAIDVHVHLREPGYTHKETIETGTLAAAKGGVTTIFAMPNLNPCPDSLDNLNYEKKLIEQKALIKVYPYASVSKGEGGVLPADFDEICPNVLAITDDGVGVNNLAILKLAMQKAKEYDVVMASHAEDLVDSKLPQGEYVAVRREIEYAKKIGCRYHFCHMSTKESFAAIQEAIKLGYENISFEVSPHHLLLNETMIKDGNFKMNPPLRDEADRLATVKALLESKNVVIASDHAPHTEAEKRQAYDKCPNGIIGLETMLPLIYTHFIANNQATHQDFINWFVDNPAKIFGLEAKEIKIGSLADIAILDIKNYRKYQKEEIVSIGKNSPFIGMELTGFPRYTIYNGKIVWRDR